MKRLLPLLFSLLGFLAFGCGDASTSSQAETTPAHAVEEFVGIRHQQFFDSQGRELVLHGINLVNKKPEENYLGRNDQAIMKQLRRWGFNCVRLGVIWDGLEPEPGQYDETYLEGLDRRIQWAREQGLYVLLDMHQDLYSVSYSDGAPEWATLHEDQPHRTGEVWSEAYFISPAVQTSFDNFWNNAPAPDGKGLQDHYVAAWKMLAKRYAAQRHLIGFDLMNEPFLGSGALQIMPLLLQAYGQMRAEAGQPLAEEALRARWESPQGRAEVFAELADPEKFARVFDAMQPLHAAFEREQLMPFYQACRDAIREVNPHHILFIEHGIYGNSGLLTGLQPLADGQGGVDARVAYAPHGYDLVTDTDAQAASSLARVQHIFDRIEQNADQLEMPVLVGEWGAFYGAKAEAVVEQARFILQLFEQKKFGHAYWSYFEGMEEQAYFQALHRAYPMAVLGSLDAYRYDLDTGELEVKWTQPSDAKGATVVYLPALNEAVQRSIELAPSSEYRFQPIREAAGGYLFISPSPEASSRSLRLVVEK